MSTVEAFQSTELTAPGPEGTAAPDGTSAHGDPRTGATGHLRVTVAGRRRPVFAEHWIIPEVPVPEPDWHYRQGKLLMSVLDHWVARTERKAKVCCNLAIRVRQDMPKMGFDPDVLLVEPPPPEQRLGSLRLWKPGHGVPSLAVEVVSPGHPYKDYRETPLKCAAVGVKELVVFDPLRVGPKGGEGPQLLQLWREQADGTFPRVAYGHGPVHSVILNAYFVAVGEGPQLRIADDPLGHRLWPTPEEAATVAYQQERLQKEVALQEKDALLERLAQLEAELDKRSP